MKERRKEGERGEVSRVMAEEGGEGAQYLGGDCSVSCSFLLCFSRSERLSRLARRP